MTEYHRTLVLCAFVGACIGAASYALGVGFFSWPYWLVTIPNSLTTGFVLAAWRMGLPKERSEAERTAVPFESPDPQTGRG